MARSKRTPEQDPVSRAEVIDAALAEGGAPSPDDYQPGGLLDDGYFAESTMVGVPRGTEEDDDADVQAELDTVAGDLGAPVAISTATAHGVPDEVALADAAVIGAKRNRARIEDAIVEGAPDVTAADLLAADDEVAKRSAIAEMARSLRTRREARQAERDRSARRAALHDLIRVRFGAHEGDIVDAIEAAEAALVPLVDAVRAHNDGLHEIAGQLRGLDGGSYDVRLSGDGDGVRVEPLDVNIERIDLGAIMCEVAWRAIHTAGALDGSRSIGALAGGAGVDQPDAHYRAHFREDLRDGYYGPSTQLRRIARIVAERGVGDDQSGAA